MKIILAKNSGFCFGVKKAVDLAFEHAGRDTYTYGEIIHNEAVTGKLAGLGVRDYGKWEMREGDGNAVLPSEVEGDHGKNSKSKVIIRSHGVGRDVYDKLVAEGFEVLDATCPFVKKIHEIVAEHYAKGYHIVIIGRRDHPEVIGINGWCDGKATVIEDEEQVSKADCFANARNDGIKLCVVCQTTFLTQKYLAIIQKIKKHAGNSLEIFDTICYTTSVRQEETQELAKKCTVMLVVGSKSSSNTSKLLGICAEHCERAYLIDGVDKLRDIKFDKSDTVGIVGGASAEEELIQEVYGFVTRLTKNIK